MQDNIFAQYITAHTQVFKRDRDALQAGFVPDDLPHRRGHLDKLASILAPAFRGHKPSNVLVFGKSGTGKTATVLYLMKEAKKGKEAEASMLGSSCGECGSFIPHGMSECASHHPVASAGVRCSKCGGVRHDGFETCPACRTPMERSVRCTSCGKAMHLYDRDCACGAENPARFSRVEFFYVNCQSVDTHYGILQNIANRFAREFDERIPPTGWSTERVYDVARVRLDEERRVVVIVLDEVDSLVYKSGDDVLYQLCKLNEDLVNASVSVVCISNDLKFTDMLDARVKSRIGTEKLVMHPYDASQIEDILRGRIAIAFSETAVSEGVVPLCAALAAKEHGDARRALNLLRVAGEIAERSLEAQVTQEHVYKAKSEIEMDCVAEAVRTLPTQSKLVLLSVIMSEESGNDRLTTGEVYTAYSEISKRAGYDRLTQRRVSDLISELDMLGILHARVKSFGRGGMTKEIESGIPAVDCKRILSEDPALAGVRDMRPLSQLKLM